MIESKIRYATRPKLAQRFPNLSEEWHPTLNGSLTPNDVCPGSRIKAWWICNKGHEWIASVTNRSGGSNCHYCTHKKLLPENSLAYVHPELIKEWHPTLNGVITPNDVFVHSRKKVWWKCVKYHEWISDVNKRSKGRNCPYCLHKKLLPENSLSYAYPNVAKEWHPTLNGNLTPNDVFAKTTKKAWWRCDRGHEWMAEIGSRAAGHNCKHCYLERYRKEKIYAPVHATQHKLPKDTYITCYECGIQMEALDWHLKVSHSMDSNFYRRKHNLPDDFPLVAPTMLNNMI